MRLPMICWPRARKASWLSWAENPCRDERARGPSRESCCHRPEGPADCGDATPEQAGSLAQGIEALGGNVLLFPVLDIAPVLAPDHFDDVAARLGTFDLAFFVSPNAVRYGLDALLARRDWPGSLAVATVGKGSERALAERGFARVVAPASGFDSEAVLALPEFAADAVRGRHVLVLRGDGGRDLLG